MCDITYDNISFSSAEHAYQYAKCFFSNKRDMGQKILLAPNGREAKLLAGNVTMIEAKLEKWKVSNVSIMGEILECMYTF